FDGGSEVMGEQAEGRFFVLRLIGRGSYFREWVRFTTGPKFQFVSSLSCARAFPARDKLLADSFQHFLAESGYVTEVCEVEGTKLLKRFSPQPRKTLCRPVIEIIDLKKEDRHFRT